ncbi:MAG: pilus assembly protein [Propionibacteriaceae bacterium]|nr:pilus assembly protein [Propionibacteriaceae bacterium]
MISAHRRKPDSTTGSVSIEAVIMVPLFISVVFVIMQGSLWVHACAVAQAAAQDGARVGTVVGGDQGDARALTSAVLTHRHVGQDWKIDTVVTRDGLTVTVSGEALSIIPGFAPKVSESSTMPWEEGRR